MMEVQRRHEYPASADDDGLVFALLIVTPVPFLCRVDFNVPPKEDEVLRGLRCCGIPIDNAILRI
jgi:hypothetical protein